MTVTVVICTRNRPAELEKCLNAVRGLKTAPDEVLVVDNSAGDEATESVARSYSARYVIEPRSGLSRARNRGLNESTSDVVAYLDDDAIPDVRWLKLLLEPFSDQQIAVVTGGIVASASELSGNKAPTRFLSNREHHWFEKAAFGSLGIGASMAFRRSACLGWAVFDERLGRGTPMHGLEEHFAFVQLLQRGFSAAHVPAALVIHSSQDTRDAMRDSRIAIAYALLLLAEFPGHRRELLRFLFGRMRGKPLTWVRDAPGPGSAIPRGWIAKFRAFWAGIRLYVASRRRIEPAREGR